MTEHKLKGYYRAALMSGLLSVVMAGIFIYLFPNYFLFLGPPNLTIALCAGIFFLHLTFFILHEVFKKQIFFTLFRYSWIVFFFAVILETGGMGSEFFYFFTFPVLVSGIDFDIKDVKVTASITFVLMFSLFFLNPHPTSELVFKHSFNIFVFAFICYLITRLVSDKEAIHRDFDRLIDVDRIKGDFITVASNRLRAPLSESLYALSKLSEDTSLTSAHKEIVAAGLQSVKTASAVVEELVHAVELDVYHFKIWPETIDLSALVQQIVKEKDEVIKTKGVQVSIFAPSIMNIKANSKMIKSAFENIIENAIIYSPNGHVEIHINEEKKSVEVIIKDDGIGIDAKDIPLIFDRLYRGAEATQLEPNRSGVGAYAAKRIIDLHKGTISLASKKGQGTTVRITLPMV
jgi:signal transduction histidine kinase